MSIYYCNPEGIEALGNVVSTLNEELYNLNNITQRLEAAAESNSGVIGPHEVEIESIVKTVYSSIVGASEPVKDLTQKILNLITLYEEIISTDLSAVLYSDDDPGSQPGPKVYVKKR